MLGGGMRQAGIIAIFGLAALETKWIQRLEEDHKNAKLLADALESFNLPIKIQKSDTNILIITLPEKARVLKIINALNKEGILAFNIKDRDIRFVTHYGISKDDIKYSVDKIGKILMDNL
jgi:threonine aldolase